MWYIHAYENGYKTTTQKDSSKAVAIETGRAIFELSTHQEASEPIKTNNDLLFAGVGIKVLVTRRACV